MRTLRAPSWLTTTLVACLAYQVGADAWAQGLPTGPTPAPGLGTPFGGQEERPPTEAETLIDEAIEKLAQITSIEATIQQSTTMLGQTFQLNGEYARAPGNRLYLRLTLSGLGNSEGSMLQISDGQTLYDRQVILQRRSLTKIDVNRFMERINDPEVTQEVRDFFLQKSGFIGPETLLKNLRQLVIFDEKQAGTLDGIPVWKIQGRWGPQAQLVGPNDTPMAPNGPLPSYMPSIVTLWLGQENGWPYRLRLVGRVPSNLDLSRVRTAPGGRLLPPQSQNDSVQPSDVLLVYSNVKLGEKIPDTRFAYAPDTRNVQDYTETLEAEIDMVVQNLAAMQAREAAAGAGTGTGAPGAGGSSAFPLPPSNPPQP